MFYTGAKNNQTPNCTDASLGASSSVTKYAARSRDGSVITGEMRSLKNGVYTVISPFGPVNIPASSVKSIEPVDAASPVSQAGTPTQHAGLGEGPLRRAGSNTIGEDLMFALLEAFATSKGAPNTEWLTEEPEEQALKATSLTAPISRRISPVKAPPPPSPRF